MEKSSNAFRTISEVADELDVPKHVLRFWEGKFSQVRPMKRGGGRRYYRPEDVDLLRGIRWLLYSDGYTIKGVQRILRDNGVRYVKACWSGLPDELESKESGPDIPDLAEEAATEARRATLKRPGKHEEKEQPAQITKISKTTGLLQDWSKERRKLLGSLLQELEDCRTILRNHLPETDQNA